MLIKNKWAHFAAYGFSSGFQVWAQKWTAPDAPSNTAVHAAITLLATAQTVTAGITNPDFPRVLIAKCTKAGGSMAGKLVTITGTDIRGSVVSDIITLGDDTAAEGLVAFKTVTSIALPTRVTAGDTVSIGIADRLGLEMIPALAVAISAHHGATLEGTLPTIVAGATIGLCTIDFNSVNNADHNQAVVFYTAERPTRLCRTS